MAILDFLFGADENPSVQSTVSTQLPLWYQQYLQKTFQQASEAANEPFQAYGAPRIAPTSPRTTQAYDTIQRGIGSYAPQYSTAASYATKAGAGFDQGEFDKYMNPYLSGVTDQIARLGARNLSENLMPAIQDTFIAAGQPGGSRATEFSARALRDTQEAILAEQARSLASGYGTALQGYGAGQERMLGAARGLGDLATAQQSGDLRGAAALEAAGLSEQQQQQRNLDLAYGDFLEQREYPRSQASYLATIMRGVPTGQTTTTTGPAMQGQLAPSPLGQIVGAGIGGYGLYNLLGLKKGGRAAKKKGGAVRKNNVVTMPKRPARGLGGFAKAA